MIKHKIALILTAVFSGILLISVVVLSILQSSTKPNLPTPDSIKIYLNSSSAEKTFNKGTTEYNEIIKLYNDSFEKSFLEQLADNDVIERAISENTAAAPWSDSNTRTGVYYEFVFDSPKKYVIYRNGHSRRVDMKSIIFQVSKEDTFKTTNVFYQVEKPSGSSSSSSNNEKETNYPLLTEANTSKLYNYAISLK